MAIRGLTIMEIVPVRGSVAFSPRSAEGAFSGREICWDGRLVAWQFVGPFQGSVVRQEGHPARRRGPVGPRFRRSIAVR
jgi:hypothetical protein